MKFQIPKLDYSTNSKFKMAGAVLATSVLLGLLLFVGITSCKKDNLLKPGQLETTSNVNPSGSITFRDGSTPTVINGILSFPTYNDGKDFAKSLESKELDRAQINSAYAQLGIDTSGETLPNLTDHPVCLVTEQSLGFTSARKLEENAINTLLNQGDDNVISIVLNPYWKTVLNADNAVRMGNRIYKYYDNGGIAIVLNNDLALYNTIKSQGFDQLQASHNLIITSDVQHGLDAFFVLNQDSSIQTEKPVFDLRFDIKLAADGKNQVSNLSLVEPATNGGSVTYLWTYGDNSTSTGLNPNKTVGANESLKVTVDNGSATTTVKEVNLGPCNATFTMTFLSGGQIKFQNTGNNWNSTILWVFSNGTTSTSNPVTKTFTSNGTATCKILNLDGTLRCEFTQSFQVNCGDPKSISKSRTFSNCGHSWKIDATLSVTNGQVQAKSKHFKKVLGIWINTNFSSNSSGVCINIAGDYIRQVLVNGVIQCNTITVNHTHCLSSGDPSGSITNTIIDNAILAHDPGQLNSSHTFTPSGSGCTTFGFGINGVPRLVLN